MNNSVGPRFAFIGTFMWFSSYIIWMVSTSAKVWVPFSTFLYGSDMTQHWRIAGLGYAGGWSAGSGMDDSGHRRCFKGD